MCHNYNFYSNNIFTRFLNLGIRNWNAKVYLFCQTGLLAKSCWSDVSIKEFFLNTVYKNIQCLAKSVPYLEWDDRSLNQYPMNNKKQFIKIFFVPRQYFAGVKKKCPKSHLCPKSTWLRQYSIIYQLQYLIGIWN